jgi:ankyrin repeat protein
MNKLWPWISSSDAVEQMMIAIANNRTGEVKRLMAKGVRGNTVGDHPVMWPDEITMFNYACRVGNIEAARLLYTKDINLEQRMTADKTPLMAACSAIRSPDWKADHEQGPQDPEAIARAEALIRLLVELGADVNAIREGDNLTVLHWAATGCSYEIVSLLIASGAKVDWPADDMQSALIMAARSNNVPALRAFVENGADMNRACLLPWAEGRTALGVLERDRINGYDKPESIAYLRSVGAREWP